MATVTGKLIKFQDWKKHPELYKKKRHCKCILTKVNCMGSILLIQDIDGLCDYHAKKFHQECEEQEKFRLDIRGEKRERRRRLRNRFKKKKEEEDS